MQLRETIVSRMRFLELALSIVQTPEDIEICVERLFNYQKMLNEIEGGSDK